MADRLQRRTCRVQPGPAPPEFYVGDTARDAACTHNDLQSAINAETSPPGTKIFVTREHTYTSQHLTVQNRNIQLIARGNGVHCGHIDPLICGPQSFLPLPTAPIATISGRSGDSVVSTSGNSTVTLTYFDINNGQQATGDDGGGIRFVGNGALTVETTWIRANDATNGGGIFFQGTGSTLSTLTVKANTQILANTADDSGGGILVSGNANLNVLEPQTVIEFNRTNSGYGGGVAALGAAPANIGSPGIAGDIATIGVLSNNTAKYGGGLALISGIDADEAPLAKLFTTDTSQPVSVANNIASHTDGGIYLKPYNGYALSSFSNYPRVCAWHFRIANNIAQEGAAICGDVDTSISSTGSIANIGNCMEIGESFPTEIGALHCTNHALCNTIDDKETDDPAKGSAILIQNNGGLYANRLLMRGNHVAHATGIVGDGAQTFLSDCLIAGNMVAHEPVYATGNVTGMTIESCTFANNLIGATHVIHTESDIAINDTNIAEPGTLALEYSGNPDNFVVHYVVSNDTSTLPAATGVGEGTPAFLDLARGDCQLKAGQVLGLDLAPVRTGFDGR